MWSARQCFPIFSVKYSSSTVRIIVYESIWPKNQKHKAYGPASRIRHTLHVYLLLRFSLSSTFFHVCTMWKNVLQYKNNKKKFYSRYHNSKFILLTRVLIFNVHKACTRWQRVKRRMKSALHCTTSIAMRFTTATTKWRRGSLQFIFFLLIIIKWHIMLCAFILPFYPNENAHTCTDSYKARKNSKFEGKSRPMVTTVCLCNANVHESHSWRY